MRTRFLALAAVVALPALAQNPSVDQGRMLLDRHEYGRAAEVLEKAAEQKTNCAEAHYLLGTAYGRMAQHAIVFRQPELAWKTKNEFERAVQCDPGYLRARFALIDYYLAAPAFLGGDTAKAYQQATEIRARNAEAGHAAFAAIHIHEKHFALAQKEYEAMVRNAPQSPKAHAEYGAFLEQQKQYDAATEELETAVRLDPNEMLAWFLIGRIASETHQNLARGAEAMQRYLSVPFHDEEDPTDADARAILSAINARMPARSQSLAGRPGQRRRR